VHAGRPDRSGATPLGPDLRLVADPMALLIEPHRWKRSPARPAAKQRSVAEAMACWSAVLSTDAVVVALTPA
jgi:hypothetical protein